MTMEVTAATVFLVMKEMTAKMVSCMRSGNGCLVYNNYSVFLKKQKQQQHTNLFLSFKICDISIHVSRPDPYKKDLNFN